jgi:hypothetical protein
MAIEFDRVEVESFEHLKQLILLNSSDPDNVWEEFERHLGLKPLGS